MIWFKGELSELHQLVAALAPPPPPPPPPPGYVSAQAVAELVRMTAARNPIGTIKAIRSLTGMGLKESKDLYEAAVGSVAFSREGLRRRALGGRGR